jgi:hypothetical protein
MAKNIFISYRRSDSKSDARSICQRLEKTFGKGRVFIDVDSINPGADFQSVLRSYLERCNIMVAVIGPRWLQSPQASGPTSNGTNHDYVYMEVASALERNLPIFPVLIDGATMPAAKDLPDNLKPLAYRQAFIVRHESFPRDMRGLEQELRRAVSTRVTGKVAAICGLSLMLAISLGAIAYFVWSSPPAPLASSTIYSMVGNFACFAEADYPKSWRDEAPLCVAYGCNFGKMSQETCLALGAKKGSKTVIHGNKHSSRENECWLQNSCGNLQPHYEFSMFKM